MRLPIAGAILALQLIKVSVLCLTADEIEAERSGWNVDPETQYHIQTDEGPERYFRFQTLNGQYRKEKRLEDGTVIGTEGWLDPLGYLRIKDYIADTKGFRILKSKMIYVGKDRPIQDAVAISKKVPATSGVLARPVRPPNPFRQPELKDVSSNSIEAAGVTPIRSYVSSTPATPVAVRFRPIAATTLRPRPFALPKPLDDDGNYLGYGRPYRGGAIRRQQQQQQQKPALLVEPPFLEQDQNHLASQNSAVARVAPTTFRGYARWNGTGPSASSNAVTSTSSSIIKVTEKPRLNARSRSRRPIAPAFRERTSPSASAPTQEYEFPGYDGTHETADRGFQYYLKKQYHEEERPRPDKTVGSFGYVDPFGIRRVVYYKADARDGFVHRKNNRYVGHGAKPYDPVPVAAEHAIN